MLKMMSKNTGFDTHRFVLDTHDTSTMRRCDDANEIVWFPIVTCKTVLIMYA